MIKTITVDGREMTFRSSGKTPIVYNYLFPGMDFLRDLESLKDSTSGEDSASLSLPVTALKVFLRLAYCAAYMACDAGQAQKDFRTDYPDEMAWLDSLETFGIYEILPVIGELWGMSSTQVVDAKNVDAAPPAR